MKKQFYAAMAALMIGGYATAQTVSVVGLDGSTLATYNLDQIEQIVFTPAEGDVPVEPEYPEGAYVIELEEGFQYEGIQVPIDAEAIAEQMDVPSLSTNYVEIYCLQDGKLYEGEYTSGGDGGYWFNTAGEVCNWATEGCAVYAEFWNDDEAWYVGQFPGTLKAGDVVEVTLVMIGNDVRVDFPFYYVCKPAKGVEGDVVFEQTVSGSAPCINDYSGAEITIDAAGAAAALGVGDLSEAQVVLQNPDGTYERIQTAGNGFYINADGSVGTWGDLSPWYIEYRYDDNANALYAGEYQTEPNTDYTAVFGFYANDKLALFTVTLKVGEDQRPAEEE